MALRGNMTLQCLRHGMLTNKSEELSSCDVAYIINQLHSCDRMSWLDCTVFWILLKEICWHGRSFAEVDVRVFSSSKCIWVVSDNNLFYPFLCVSGCYFTVLPVHLESLLCRVYLLPVTIEVTSLGYRDRCFVKSVSETSYTHLLCTVSYGV